MVFLDLPLSEDQTASYYCEYSLTKSLHYWNKSFPPILWLEIKITQEKRLQKITGKRFTHPSLLGMRLKSNNTFMIFLQSSATWVSQGYSWVESVFVVTPWQEFNPGKRKLW